MMSNGKRGRRPLGRLWDPTHLESVVGDWLSRPGRDPRGFAAALFLARHLRSPNTLRTLAKAVASAMELESLAEVLPLAILDDLRWLAGLEEAGEVRAALLHAIPGLGPPASEPN
jgi:hypothetical protein